MENCEKTEPKQDTSQAQASTQQASVLSRFKKARWYWLLGSLVIGLLITAVVFVLLLHRPGDYNPPDTDPAGSNPKEVSPYLTNELLPQLYNGAQLEEPFEVVVTQKGINDIVARSKWPKHSEGTSLLAPDVLFVPNGVVLMGTAIVGGVEFIVTIVLEPAFDRQDLLNLRVAKVKVGAMNITPLAKLMAKRMYSKHLADTEVDTEAVGAQIAGSLLSDEPFEPVFKIEDKKVRIRKITITEGKLRMRLVPVFE